jgi:phosphatidate phosphatase LPIN
LSQSSTLKDDNGIVGDVSNDLLSSLAALKLKNSSIEELENATGGSAFHSLLNRSVGLEESQHAGHPSCSLVAQAALAAVTKAAWEPGIEDSSKGLGNGSRDLFEVINNSGAVIAEGFRLRKSKSLNLRSGQIVDKPVRVRRVRSESDLRLLDSDVEGIKSEADLRLREIGDNSPMLSTLTITSADGVVVLHTPRRGSPPPLTSREDHIQTLQQPIIFEGDGLEKPVVLGMLSFEQVVTDNTQGDIPAEELNPSPDKKEVGALITAGSGGWKLWPFPLRRSKTPEMNGSAPLISREALMVAANAGVGSALVNDLVSEGDYYLRSRKNKVRSFLPTSQMLSSMNLKEGSNRITFTFFTRVLGKQQVRGILFIQSSAF